MNLIKATFWQWENSHKQMKLLDHRPNLTRDSDNHISLSKKSHADYEPNLLSSSLRCHHRILTSMFAIYRCTKHIFTCGISFQQKCETFRCTILHDFHKTMGDLITSVRQVSLGLSNDSVGPLILVHKMREKYRIKAVKWFQILCPN